MKTVMTSQNTMSIKTIITQIMMRRKTGISILMKKKNIIMLMSEQIHIFG
jgi:hypothetical protein